MSDERLIYCDHAATTPLLPEAREAMEPFLSREFGNPSSLHAPGRRAKAALEDAREGLAALIGASAEEIIFTSGGSEGNNLAIKGTAWAARDRGRHIITTQIEHPSVLGPCGFLEAAGFEVTCVPVDSRGLADPDDVRRFIRPGTVLISVMHANNEIGTIEPVFAIAALAREAGVLFHTDAVQTFGHLPFQISESGPDLVSVSAHKLGGPRGAGFLYVRKGTALEPLIHGGAQEMRLRAGTPNVAAIAGFARAATLVYDGLAQESLRVMSLRDRLQQRITKEIGGATVNGLGAPRLPGHLSVTIPGADADAVVIGMDRGGICCSSGAACMSANFEPSHVLTAMGRSRAEAAATVRLSLGRGNTDRDVDDAAAVFAEIAEKIRGVGI